MKSVAISFIHVASLLIFTLASGHAGAQSLSIRGDLDLSVGNFKQNNRTRVISGSSASYYVDQADIGYAGLYAYTDQYSGGSIFKDYAGDTILYLGSAMNSHGKVGIGTTSPNGRMEIIGDIVFHPVTSLYGTSGKAKLFSYTDSGLTFMCAMDSSGYATPISPHRFSLFQPDPNEALPWSYYSENRFVGKKINVDMAGAIRAIERLSGQKFIYYADLPASERIRIDDWKASETQRMINDAKLMEIEKMPLVEIPFSEAWEQVDEVEKAKSV